jgi:hypothetical protein
MQNCVLTDLLYFKMVAFILNVYCYRLFIVCEIELLCNLTSVILKTKHELLFWLFLQAVVVPKLTL